MSLAPIGSQSLSAMPQRSTGDDASNLPDDLGDIPAFSQFMSMTNAELVQFGKDHGLANIVDFFSVNYASADRSASGETSMLSSLMGDPTKHDFIKEFTSNAQWDASIGDVDGSASLMNIVNELEAAVGGHGNST